MAAIRKAKIKTEQSRSKLKSKPILEEQIKNKNYRLEQEKNMEGGCRNRIPGVDREGPTTELTLKVLLLLTWIEAWLQDRITP